MGYGTFCADTQASSAKAKIPQCEVRGQGIMGYQWSSPERRSASPGERWWLRRHSRAALTAAWQGDEQQVRNEQNKRGEGLQFNTLSRRAELHLAGHLPAHTHTHTRLK